MIPRCIKSLLVFLLVALICQSARAVTIFNVYDANVNNRFDSTSFIGASYDWSGVGKSGRHWATMITPSYFISANHAHPGHGSTVTFWESNISAVATVERTVAGGQRIDNTDLWVGYFDTPVTNAIATYDIAPNATLSASGMGSYANLPSYTVGTGGVEGFVVGQNKFDVVETMPETLTGISVGSFDAIGYVQDVSGDTNFTGNSETFLQGGDSGAPSFIVDGMNLQLAGIHSFITDPPGATIADFGTGPDMFDYKTPETWTDPNEPPTITRNISFDNFVPSYASQIQAATVPEPSCLALLGIATIGAAGYGSRRRRRKHPA